MKEGKPSLTAIWVAGLRGLASTTHDRIVDDPFAERLVPQPYRSLLTAARNAPRFMTPFHRVADVLTLGRSRHMPMRTRAIDDALAESMAHGAEQVVILGAGLDARAWRLDALSHAVVYEIDHPAMQAYKRSRIDREIPCAREVRFVAVDFERDDLATSLAAAGHDASRPTAFVWEGVTMYLTRQALDGTLAAIASRAAPGSTLLMTYFVRQSMRPEERALVRLLSFVGEPVKSDFTPAEITSLVAEHGFETLSDEGDPEWSLRYFHQAQSWTMERLSIARQRARRGGAPR